MTKTLLELPILSFPDSQSFEVWVEKHHSTIPGIWLKFYKKASGIPTVTYDEALDVALCYGWIDSQVKSIDEKAYLQRFGPRVSRSPWSEINKGHVARLINEGRMREAGLRAIEAAKANGQWENAYASPSKTIPSKEFQKALEGNQKAKAFFESISKTQQFYFTYWIQSAKREETKEKRIKEAVAMLERREKRM